MGLGFSAQPKARHCSQCQDKIEFHSSSCKRDLCVPCKEKHVTDDSTKNHNVVFYRTRPTGRSLPFTTQCKVRQCLECQGDTEFYNYCNTCIRNLCVQCKEKHVMDLYTKHHEVVIYREKFGFFPYD
jgi:hypothetical protein